MNLPQADFLTAAEFCRGPDLLRPGTLTGMNVDPGAIAFIYCAFVYSGEESDICVSEADSHLISWPAAMGHEEVADRESVLRALFGTDFKEATKGVSYEQPIYELDDQGNVKSGLIVIGTKLAYDAIELRRLAVKQNLFGRFGIVRAVPCLMLWHRCENWEATVDNLLVLLDVSDSGVITMGNVDQRWVRDWKASEE